MKDFRSEEGIRRMTAGNRDAGMGADLPDREVQRSAQARLLALQLVDVEAIQNAQQQESVWQASQQAAAPDIV